MEEGGRLSRAVPGHDRFRQRRGQLLGHHQRRAFAINADLIEAEGTLDELHKVSWARADKSHGAFCEAMKREKDQDTNR